MSSGSGAEPTEEHQAAIGPVATGMDATLMVATDSGEVQQLKDLVKKQQDSEIMVVVMAKKAAENHHPQQGSTIDPHLLALASSGSCEKLRTLVIRGGDDARQASGSNGTGDERLSTRMRRASNDDDVEANNEPILEGVTAEGDTALHVVAACGQGDNLFTRFREAKHLLVRVQQNQAETTRRRRRRLTRAERHALSTYGDGDNFLETARIIYEEARHLLFARNKNGDTPLHCAARAGKSNMVKCLIDLALAESGGEARMKELLRTENKNKETALHEAVRVGNNSIVDLLMDKDSELASFPPPPAVEREHAQGDCPVSSPLYLAIVLRRDDIVNTLYDKTISNNSHGKLSFTGPNGQNALHAAVLRGRGVTELLLRRIESEAHLGRQIKDHITKQRDEKGSTPLHFAAAIEEDGSKICRQVLEANPDALYVADHAAGFFPIHVAASVGAFRNIDMFVKTCPGTAGLRDAKGRTFLHLAAEKRKVKVVSAACRNLSLSWIMNMVDNDGNTALHLAVNAGSLRMFCSLLGNLQVNLDLPNKKGDTPLDIADYKVTGFHYKLNSEAQICRVLRISGAAKGARRKDHSEVVKRDESKELEALKDSAGAMCIVSVLITTVTFGTTFAVPGGYIADDHNNGGSPILAPRYAFDAFIASNTLAFIFSAMATIGLMYSGSPLWDLSSRKMHLATAYYLLSISLASLAAAFALGAYAVLAPVAHRTAVATCVLTSLVLLYTNVQFIWIRLIQLPPLCMRKGLIWAWGNTATNIMGRILFNNWPLLVVFGWAAYANPGSKIQAPAPVPAPAPLA